MKKSILITMMFSLCLFMGIKSIGAPSGGDNNWTLNKSNSNVDFYYQISECNGEKVIFLKFDNKNDYSVQVTWKEAVSDKTFGNVIEGRYGEKQITLAPGTTLQDDCVNIEHAECLTYMSKVDPTHPVDPMNFEFKDITVTKVAK